ncbi:MAG: beta-lactamase [Candidatus Solibacter sp.]|nr:beta-lactamase [Candidatus Solibacter sp.]
MRVLFFLLSVSCAAAQNAAVDKIFSALDKKDSPGCALTVMREGKVIYSRGYGMADLDHDIPISAGSVFHVASISKQFTAASILMLAEDGKLSIDDDVHKYIPELPNFGAKITLRHLLTHTSGMRDQWAMLGMNSWRLNLDLITDQDVLDILSKQKALNFPPGEQYLYSNSGFTLLALTVKRVSGKSLREFTQERIFGPLGMTHTFFRDNHAEIVKNQAYGYIRVGAGRFELRIPNFDTTGATSLLTTAEDFAKWDANFDHPKILGTVLAKMSERAHLNNGDAIDYGFGLQPGVYRGLDAIGHGGADAGYKADYMRFPKEHLAIACLCNLGQLIPRDFSKQVAAVYLGDKMTPLETPAPPATTTSAAVPKDALGLYYNKDLGDIRRIMERNGRLFLYSPGPRTENLSVAGPAKLQIAAPVGSGGTVALAGDRITETRPGAHPEVYERRAEAQPKDLAAYAGTYHSDELDVPYQIQVTDGKLWLKRMKYKPTLLAPTMADGFLTPVNNSEAHLEFERDPQGRVTGFLLNIGRVRHLRFQR